MYVCVDAECTGINLEWASPKMEAYATMSDFTTVDATTPNAYDNVIFTSDLIRYGFFDDGGYAYANPFNQWWTLTD